MIVTSVQIKTAKTQKHLYCPVFTRRSKVRFAPAYFSGTVFFVVKDVFGIVFDIVGKI